VFYAVSGQLPFSYRPATAYLPPNYRPATAQLPLRIAQHPSRTFVDKCHGGLQITAQLIPADVHLTDSPSYRPATARLPPSCPQQCPITIQIPGYRCFLQLLPTYRPEAAQQPPRDGQTTVPAAPSCHQVTAQFPSTYRPCAVQLAPSCLQLPPRCRRVPPSYRQALPGCDGLPSRHRPATAQLPSHLVPPVSS